MDCVMLEYVFVVIVLMGELILGDSFVCEG